MSINHDIPKETPTDLLSFLSWPSSQEAAGAILSDIMVAVFDLAFTAPNLSQCSLKQSKRKEKQQNILPLTPIIGLLPSQYNNFQRYSILIHKDILYFYAYKFSST